MNDKLLIPLFPRKEQQKSEIDLLAEAALFLDQHPIYFVLKQGVYFIRKQNGEWMPVKPTSIKHHFPEWNIKGFPLAVTVVLNDRGWTYSDVTYSFRDNVPSDVINLADRSEWLVPDVGEHHWIFNVLVQSIGGGKIENIEHLRRVITFKYLYPYAYTLPCIVVHGEGGVGKNLLVDHVLHTIFAGQTLSAKAEHVVGQFNGLLKGMAVVMLDETENDKVNESALKHTLGREKLTINEKGIPQYEIDNTPLYLISSNKSEGGIWLDRSQADRRYSVFHVKKGQPLQYWIARYQGWISEERQFLSEDDPAFVRAWQWLLSEGAAILRNPSEVAKWLGYLLIEYGDYPQPLPLHGADFERLMEIQTPMWERITQAVFSDPDFSHIERSVLYRGYRALCSALGQRPMSDKKFFEKVREWLERHHAEITEGKVRQGCARNPHLWYSTIRSDTVRRRDNADRYVVKDGYADHWTGPEV